METSFVKIVRFQILMWCLTNVSIGLLFCRSFAIILTKLSVFTLFSFRPPSKKRKKKESCSPCAKNYCCSLAAFGERGLWNPVNCLSYKILFKILNNFFPQNFFSHLKAFFQLLSLNENEKLSLFHVMVFSLNRKPVKLNAS